MTSCMRVREKIIYYFNFLSSELNEKLIKFTLDVEKEKRPLL